MKSFFNKIKNIWADESAQGATEYILLLVVVVAVVFIFKGKIKELMEGKMSEIKDSVMGFKDN